MVSVDPRRGAPAQGPAVLSPVRGKRRDRIHCLRFRAEPVARHVRQAGPSSPSRQGVRAGRGGRLSAAQFAAELILATRTKLKRRAGGAPLDQSEVAATAWAPPGLTSAADLRASCAP